MSTRTPAQAAAWANKTAKGYAGLCLQFVRLAYGVGPKYASAIDAWNGAKKKHRSLANAPVGAPVFFSGSRYGHVAIYLGDGKIRTTNSYTGRIHTDAISAWEKVGYTTLGWAEDLNGVDVAKPVKKTSAKAPTKTPGKITTTLYKGSKGAEVKALQKVLNAWYPGLTPLDEDGIYGGGTEGRVRYYQRKAGLKQDGVAGKDTLKGLGLR